MSIETTETDRLKGRIASLENALIEALSALYIDGKKPPYTVPYAVDHDLWLFTECKTRQEALETIRNAAKGKD